MRMASPRSGVYGERTDMLGYYNYTVWLTFLGFMSGVMGIFCAAQGMLLPAVGMLLFSGLCDLFDGMVARTRERTEEEKKFGIQLDSLSDLVCFGVLPAFIGFKLGLDALWQMLLLAAFALCGLIRLAYFNVAEEMRQKSEAGVRKHYNGLPITTTALIIPMVFCFRGLCGDFFPWVYLATTTLCGFCFINGKLKVRKPKLREMLIMVILGALLMTILVLNR